MSIPLLELPREILILIFEYLESPEAFSMSCRALNAFARDPMVASSWLLGASESQRHRYKRMLICLPILDRLVCFLYIPGRKQWH